MKTILYWILAVIITLGAMIYQRATGPTYDKKVEVKIDDQLYQFKLARSHGGDLDCKIEFEIPDTLINGNISYRKFPTSDPWISNKMERAGKNLIGVLPHQPPAGKLEYKIELSRDGKLYSLNQGQATVIRFKGDVPAGILIPHILFMFIAMLLANLAGIMAIFKHRKFRFYSNATFVLLILGGLVFGPWVQWHAFGEAWAGVPFGWDLTDNKTLIAAIFWLVAVLGNRKKERPALTIVASLVMLIIFSIPHSMFGSELNPETGEIIQGLIFVPFLLFRASLRVKP